MKKNTGKLRYAVVGLGHIAQTAVLPAFAHAKREAKLAALVSGDEKKLRELGKKYRVGRLASYEEYEMLLDSGDIDAVYIALPNHLHAAYALQALRRGIHVLCEKPLAKTEAECRNLVEAAAETGAKLMTAYRLHFSEGNLKAGKIAREKLGELRYFSSNFSYRLKDPGNIRLEAEEGGPLWDIGIYCVNAVRSIFRDEPTEVSAFAAEGRSAKFRRVPEGVSVVMKFPRDRLATFNCSFGAGDAAQYEVVGEKGSLRLDNAYEYTMPMELHVKTGERRQKLRFKKVDQFAAELVYFAECVRKDRVPEPSGLEGWADVRVLLAVEESLRYGRAVALGRASEKIARKKHPGLKLLHRKPPVPKAPEGVNVQSPSGD